LLEEPTWKEIVEHILPRAYARQAREGLKALALGERSGLSREGMAIATADVRKEYDGLVKAQQKLAALLASGALDAPDQVDTAPIAAAMGALQGPPSAGV